MSTHAGMHIDAPHHYRSTTEEGRSRGGSKACPTIEILFASEPRETRLKPGERILHLCDRCVKDRRIRVLGRAGGLLRFSGGNPKLSRRDAGDPLEVKGKIAVVREACAARDLH
jgi:hypothetical protein